MTKEEFHNARTPFYIDIQTEAIIIAKDAKYKNLSHAEWFNQIKYPWRNTTRGYYIEDQRILMLYTNDFELPNVTADFLAYMFAYFPGFTQIGLGCIKGEEGEIWKPKLVVTRN